MNDNDNKIYESLATSYAESEGARLKSEMEALEKSNFQYPAALDRRIGRIINIEKRRKKIIKYAPVAACLIITLIIFISQRYFFTEPPAATPIADTTPLQEYDLQFMSTRLPDKYYVTNIDYDNGQAIYHIENETKNEIIIIVESSDSPINSEGFRAISINDTEAYGISKPEYSLLTYEKDSTIYTLTSKYNYLDLIQISEKIISI